MYHKTGIGPLVTYPVELEGSQRKDLHNHDKGGKPHADLGKFNTTLNAGVSYYVSGINPSPGVDSISFLECWRPLIYEPEIYAKALSNGFLNLPGVRHSRELPSVILTGSFRIRMIEGVNDATKWARTIEPSAITMNERYGNDGFSSVQYVRAICIECTDMGMGFGTAPNSVTSVLQNGDTRNWRQDDSSGTGTSGMEDSCMKHLLAPDLGDIFDGVEIDPDNLYSTEPTERHYFNEDMIHWKYSTTKANVATPEAGLDEFAGVASTVDPLRGARRQRKFRVLIDKKISFRPYGDSTASQNQAGGREHEFNWKVKIKNMRCQMEGNGYISVHRVNQACNKRIFWYFLSSCSNMVNQQLSNSGEGAGQKAYNTHGHHVFTVTRGAEKGYWIEKNSN